MEIILVTRRIALMVNKPKGEVFIICPKNKSLPKKSVHVCRKCRRLKTCPAYRKYVQPGLPFLVEDKK